MLGSLPVLDELHVCDGAVDFANCIATPRMERGVS